MSLFHVWVNNTVRSVDGKVFNSTTLGCPIYDLLCIDAGESEDRWRYGAFSKNGWEHHPFDTFPPEFRAALLLMGVS